MTDPLHVLVINSGSSSIKFRLYGMAQEILRVSGTLARIGEANSSSIYRVYRAGGGIDEHHDESATVDHSAGLQKIFAFFTRAASIAAMEKLYAIGHRIVHGGEAFQAPTLIDDAVIDGIRAVIPLAPLHNPANLTGIEAARALCPGVPQVAVFDTAFFRTLPPHAYRYAVPDDLYRQHVRRYGFHGTSHQYVASASADFLQRPLASLRLITLHLGNGASAAAIRDGICIDTSMGMTPLEGLIMGTRCGDVDPSLPFYLVRTLGIPLDNIEEMLNHDSGMQGLCGVSDMREVHRIADNGDVQARLALEMYSYRICKYVGAYYAALGGLDALVFTAGIGENDTRVRQTVCDRLAAFGITLDQQRNTAGADGAFDISGENSKVKVLVVPTNEELEIARQALTAIRDRGNT